MTWQKYTLAFRLCSPLHIGWRKTGNLMQTRPYVSGKVLWAALTARLTREAGHGAEGQMYLEIGKQVNENFRFGYLYPALPCHPTQPVAHATDLCAHYPWRDPHFDYRFLDSQASTALNYDQQAAEEGLLHETEFIRPHARRLPGEATAPQVYLLGLLFVKAALPTCLQGWQAARTRLQLGGERGYGWGRVQPLPLSEPLLLAEPTLTLAQDMAVAAHVYAASAPLVGPIEPLLGWERDNERQDRNWRLTPQVQLCYAPGSKVARTTTFTIGNDGLWQPLT